MQPTTPPAFALLPIPGEDPLARTRLELVALVDEVGALAAAHARHAERPTDATRSQLESRREIVERRADALAELTTHYSRAVERELARLSADPTATAAECARLDAAAQFLTDVTVDVIGRIAAAARATAAAELAAELTRVREAFGRAEAALATPTPRSSPHD